MGGEGLVSGSALAVGCSSSRPRGVLIILRPKAGGFFDWSGAGAHPTAAEPSGVENAELHGRAAAALPGTLGFLVGEVSTPQS